MAVRKSDDLPNAVISQKVVSVEPVTLIEVTASRGFRVNLGNYEHADTFASAKVTVTPDADMNSIMDKLNDTIDSIQLEDLKWYLSLAEARKQSSTLAHHILQK